MLVGALTGLTYLAIALDVDPVPGLHVGGCSMAMPKVAAICNFVAALVGGTVAHLTPSRGAIGALQQPRVEEGSVPEVDVIAWDRNPAQTVIHRDQTCSYICDKNPPKPTEGFKTRYGRLAIHV